MKLSTDRILTTHVGSLPRSAAVTDVLLKKERGERYDRGEFDRVIREAVIETVARQIATVRLLHLRRLRQGRPGGGIQEAALPHRGRAHSERAAVELSFRAARERRWHRTGNE